MYTHSHWVFFGKITQIIPRKIIAKSSAQHIPIVKPGLSWLAWRGPKQNLEKNPIRIC
jgi:hypothetical protein